jgi:hypothetical protein
LPTFIKNEISIIRTSRQESQKKGKGKWSKCAQMSPAGKKASINARNILALPKIMNIRKNESILNKALPFRDFFSNKNQPSSKSGIAITSSRISCALKP